MGYFSKHARKSSGESAGIGSLGVGGGFLNFANLN
jgi:hypothetical protein